MKTVHTIEEVRKEIQNAKRAGLKTAFVPTMGNLHEGHISLITKGRELAEFVVCSIFVNPMQFGANEDLDAYPRTLEADQSKLKDAGCDLLFAPNALEVYPNGMNGQTRVEVPELGNFHCGASRPGHFVGVATVVCKLFNIVQSDIAIFGEKDFQQLAIIRKMSQDLCFPVEIIGVPTSREANGLARSSRNGYLSEAQKNTASAIYRCLKKTAEAIQEGERDYAMLSARAISDLEAEGFKGDYFNIANAQTLEPATEDDSDLVILVAALMGTTRLIDNISVKL